MVSSRHSTARASVFEQELFVDDIGRVFANIAEVLLVTIWVCSRAPATDYLYEFRKVLDS